MSEFVLEMRDVCKSFPGVKALDHAQLKLRPGTVHALMGENGAGKSTLMKCMFGIYSMDEGEIYIDGVKTVIRDPWRPGTRVFPWYTRSSSPSPTGLSAKTFFSATIP